MIEALQTRLSELAISLPEDDIAAMAPLYEQYKDYAGKPVMVMFSGGLDTSFIAHFLNTVIGADVTTFSADVGSAIDPDTVNSRAAERSELMGITSHIHKDCKDELAALGMQAVMAEAKLSREGHHPASSLSRIAICHEAVKLAKEKNITAVFHGSNGTQNNPMRFHVYLEHFKKKYDYSDLKEETHNMRKDALPSDQFRQTQRHYLNAFGKPLPGDALESTISSDDNMLGKEFEEGAFADPNHVINRDSLLEKFPKAEGEISIALRFHEGKPVALRIDGAEWEEKSPAEMLIALNRIGLEHRIGWCDHPEQRHTLINKKNKPLKAREIHFSPAMDILHHAHSHLKAYHFDSHITAELDKLSIEWSRSLMEDGKYFTPSMHLMNNTFRIANEELSGEISLIFKNEKIVSITSPIGRDVMESEHDPATPPRIQENVATFSNKTAVKSFREQKTERIAEGRSDPVATAMVLKARGKSLLERQLALTLGKVSENNYASR